MPSRQRVLVVDDNEAFVDSLVDAFKRAGEDASGCADPARLETMAKRGGFEYDVVLLDMDLGTQPDGDVLNAAKVIPTVKAYAPDAQVVVFSRQDMTPDECMACIEFGALTVVTKALNPDEPTLVKKVRQALEDRNERNPALIRDLWERLDKGRKPRSGEDLEQLVAVLFNSMPEFEVIGHDLSTPAGGFDMLVKNGGDDQFWRALESPNLVVECKNRGEKTDIDDFNHLRAVVETQGASARTGVMVSLGGVSRVFRDTQAARRGADGIHIFRLERPELEELVRLSFGDRAEYLRKVFSRP
jgi:CheY-like chemotaxis protein